MKLKILKILTVISFLTITYNGPHIGGQWGIFLILLLLDWSIHSITSIIYLSFLILIIISAFKEFKKADKYIFLFSGILLLIPIIGKHVNDISSSKLDIKFIITTLIFVTIYSTTLYFISKNKIIS